MRAKHLAQMAATVESLVRLEMAERGKVSVEGHLARLDVLTYQLRFFFGRGSMARELLQAEENIASALRVLAELAGPGVGGNEKDVFEAQRNTSLALAELRELTESYENGVSRN
jgi:hypothetical protein